MSTADLAAGVVLAGLMAYAMFGGADFGAGVWTALSFGPRGAEQREAIFRAMGPVWETNHVWLILVIVTLFTAFPEAFANLFTALLIPLVIALVGIVFRGAAFAFRHYGYTAGTRLPATGAVFSVTSLATPMSMGVAVGTVAAGKISIEGGRVVSGLWEPWLRPFPILCGIIAVAACGFLTACYMTTRTTGPLREEFRNRALAASLSLGILTTVAIPVAYADAKPFWHQLDDPLPIATMALAAGAGVASLLVLWQRIYPLAPPVAAATVALVLAGWGVAQYPYLIPPTERIGDLAAGPATLNAFLVSLAVGALILIPSLFLLYATFSEKTGGPEAAASGYEHDA